MRVLVTGCSTGIGRATAVELTARGHEVVATARRPASLDDLDVAERLALDVTDDASVAAAVEAAGPLDALVSNAGVSVHAPLETVPLDEVRRVLETNLVGVLRTIQAVVPGMRERGGGVLVNVSSVNGRVASPLSGPYAASKYALEALSEVLHYELGHFGIRTVIIEPGFFETSITDNTPSYGLDGPPYDELDRQVSQLGERLGRSERPGPEVVARAVAAALEDDATPLRVPVGADAELVLGTRAGLDDAAFEAAMRSTLDLTW